MPFSSFFLEMFFHFWISPTSLDSSLSFGFPLPEQAGSLQWWKQAFLCKGPTLSWACTETGLKPFSEKRQRTCSQLHLRYLQPIAAWTQRVRYRVGGMKNFRDCCKWQQILGAIITTRLAWAAAKLQLRAQALHVFTGMVCLFLAIEKRSQSAAANCCSEILYCERNSMWQHRKVPHLLTWKDANDENNEENNEDDGDEEKQVSSSSRMSIFCSVHLLYFLEMWLGWSASGFWNSPHLASCHQSPWKAKDFSFATSSQHCDKAFESAQELSLELGPQPTKKILRIGWKGLFACFWLSLAVSDRWNQQEEER